VSAKVLAIPWHKEPIEQPVGQAGRAFAPRFGICQASLYLSSGMRSADTAADVMDTMDDHCRTEKKSVACREMWDGFATVAGRGGSDSGPQNAPRVTNRLTFNQAPSRAPAR
jgi:hypothetical protein